MLKKILSREIGTVTDEEIAFAKQGIKDERKLKGLYFKHKGERLDLMASYIFFYRKYKEGLN